MFLKYLPDRVFRFIVECVKVDQEGVRRDDALQGNSCGAASMGQ